MSNQTNTDLLERVQDCLDYADNHPSGIHVSLANELNKEHPDLDELRRFVSIIEGMQSQEHFAELLGSEL